MRADESKNLIAEHQIISVYILVKKYGGKLLFPVVLCHTLNKYHTQMMTLCCLLSRGKKERESEDYKERQWASPRKSATSSFDVGSNMLSDDQK